MRNVPHRLMGLNLWFPARGPVLAGCGSFRRWVLVTGSESTGEGLEVSSSSPTSSLLSASWSNSVNSHLSEFKAKISTTKTWTCGERLPACRSKENSTSNPDQCPKQSQRGNFIQRACTELHRDGPIPQQAQFRATCLHMLSLYQKNCS